MTLTDPSTSTDATSDRTREAPWQILDANSIWIKEFAAALHQFVPVLAWLPQMSWTGALRRATKDETLLDPPVPTCRFPLQRGYSRPPVSWLTRFEKAQTARLVSRGSRSPLICTTPYYAPVAEKWQGPVAYYLTDLTKAYKGVNPRRIIDLDRRMCRIATLVCPNSRRIADYLQREASCPASKIVIVPNATREANVLPYPPEGPWPPPRDIEHLPRPIVGVIGNLAGNLDWLLIENAVRASRAVSWVFVGPTSEPVADPDHRRARDYLLSAGGVVVFTGAKRYGQLRDYARCFDAAFLPYRTNLEPTFSGSSTRFYEHLAACRPMMATRGFQELLHKEPLLTLVNGPAEVAAFLSTLRDRGFRDGYEELRWRASLEETWNRRALAVYHALRPPPG